MNPPSDHPAWAGFSGSETDFQELWGLELTVPGTGEYLDRLGPVWGQKTPRSEAVAAPTYTLARTRCDLGLVLYTRTFRR